MEYENREKPKKRIFLKLIIIAIFIACIAFLVRIAPNYYVRNEIKDKTNLVINFSNVTGRMKKDMIIEDGTVYLSFNDIMNYYDDNIYYDEQYNQIVTSSETKLAVLKLDENKMTVNGVTTEIKGAAKLEDETYYLPISEMEEVYNIKVTQPENKVVIESLDKKLTTATTNKKVEIKYKTTFFSKTIEKVDANDKLVIVDVDENTLPEGWVRVRTQNGNMGYVEEKNLNDIHVEREETVYGKQFDGKISLAWDYFSEYGKAPDNTGITYNGVNVVSPSFFYLKLEDTEKEKLTTLDVFSQAKVLENVGDDGVQYINWAHSNGYEVWGKVANETNVNTIDEFSYIINDYKLREIMIKDIISYAKKYDLDGINLDFEYMRKDDVDEFSKFVIELAPQLRDIGVCFSVDVTAPNGGANWSLCYDRRVIGEVADYVVFMGYDQYGANSIGTTAGYSWVKNSIENFLNYEGVQKEKLILALPFYTRLWKTKDGEVVDRPQTIYIKNIEEAIPANCTKEWKEDLQQYYVQYEQNGYVYKLWVEDEQSFSKKLDLVQEYDLAGAGYWEKSFASDSIWNIVKKSLKLQ